MKIGKTQVDNFATISKSFRGIRYTKDGWLEPRTWNIEVEVAAEESMTNCDLAVTKLINWFDFLEDIIVVPFSSMEAINIVNNCENAMMQAPDTDDDTIAKLIFLKVLSLGNGNVAIGSLKLKTDNNPIGYCFASKSMLDIPDVALDQIVHDTNWWNRNDSTTFEYATTDKNQIEEILNQDDPLDEIEKAIKSRNNKTDPADIIEVNEWCKK